MPYGIIIDIDTKVRGAERCINNIPIFNNRDNKQDFIVTQIYKNDYKTTIK